jgi:uncharacterized protein (DUF4415 family)
MKKTEMKEEYDFCKGKRGAVISHRGKTRITIWIDTDTLNWFKDMAEREGRGYQTAMNDALHSYTQQEHKTIQEIVREAVREELKKMKKAG